MPRPVVVGGRKGFCSRAIPGPGPSQNPALCGSPPTKCLARITGSAALTFPSLSAVVVCGYPAASTHSRFGQRSCPRPLRSRGQLHCRRSRAGSFRRQRPGSRQSRQPRLCRLHSAVRLRRVYLYLPAIPPHLRRGEPRRKCSGRAGAAVPAAGAENVGLQNSEHHHPGAGKRGKRAPGAPPFRSICTHFCKAYR